jgi:hypothetical protein
VHSALSTLCGFRRSLGGLLEGPDRDQWIGSCDVGDDRKDPSSPAGQGREDLCLLLTETWKFVETLEADPAVFDLGPDRRDIPIVVLPPELA